MTWAASIVLGRLSAAIMCIIPEYSLNRDSVDEVFYTWLSNCECM